MNSSGSIEYGAFSACEEIAHPALIRLTEGLHMSGVNLAKLRCSSSGRPRSSGSGSRLGTWTTFSPTTPNVSGRPRSSSRSGRVG